MLMLTYFYTPFSTGYYFRSKSGLIGYYVYLEFVWSVRSILNNQNLDARAHVIFGIINTDSWAAGTGYHVMHVFLQVRVSQLKVDGGGKCRFPSAAQSLYPPGFTGFRRHLDETSGQL